MVRRQRSLPALLIGAALLVAPASATASLRIGDRHSPRNAERPRRPHTRYIILHTTEGAGLGALAKLRREGEAHYLVRRNGQVLRIIDKDRIATHAGRSLWDGHRNLDDWAIGIEIVGYHHRPLRKKQIPALRELIRQLQTVYDIPDENVLTHSMVAYGNPNRYHRYKHRGRKRCAMMLGDPAVRAQLGLKKRPLSDPDVKAGRLRVADRELFSFLFRPGAAKAAAVAPAPVAPKVDPHVVTARRSPWDIAREDYDSAAVTYTFPNGRKKRGDEIRNWKKIPPGTRVSLNDDARSGEGFEGFRIVGRHGDSAEEIAGEELRKASTIYFFPSGLIRTGAELAADPTRRGLLSRAPKGTRILMGYTYGGYVTGRRPPSVICGSKWNYPSTFYRMPGGRVRSGDGINAAAIPRRTLVFYRQ